MVEYLTTRPMLTEERHAQYFRDLSTHETLRVLTRLEQDLLVPRSTRLDPVSGRSLFDLCQHEGLDHAAVVFSMGRETDGIGLPALEKLIGHPITVWRRPSYVQRTVQQERDLLQARKSAGPHVSGEQVVLAVTPNPKKPASSSWARYQHWVAGRTVAECLAAGLQRADVAWDTDPGRHFVVLGTRQQWEEAHGGSG
jgi:hypothetical protein